MPDAAHEQLCGSCWLDSLGIDQRVVGALVSVAWEIGMAAGTALASLPPGIRPKELPPVDANVMQMLIQVARARLEVPASPDVEAAMRGQH